MEVLGYILAILSGVSLGLIGGGGSILTIPILVYIFGIEAAETAPAYSLFIVGIASLIGVFVKARKNEVDFKAAAYFGVPTVIAIFVTRQYLVPIIPATILTIESFKLSKRFFIMGFFAIIMIAAAFIMIKGEKKINKIPLKKKAPVLNFFGGLGIGGLTGLIGAGGGFIIIPALIKIGNLTMKTAIGTSLAIITMNSFFGFLGSISQTTIDWTLLILFTLLASVGIFIGAFFSKKIDNAALKKGFGYFVLIMGLFILIKEILTN
ncbi:MAG: sulfite exporter TauE/SafE family protein [Vicingus serpentipes]|nr:sulfite exporter TauE/SafE family protein [Vicingus serpentipes]